VAVRFDTGRFLFEKVSKSVIILHYSYNLHLMKTTPRDFFLHLGIIVTLYVSAVSVLALLFQVIDLAFPDQLTSYIDPYSTSMRLAIASLIIFFPVYILLGWLYNKELVHTPEKKDLAIRRWLVYFTLFVTGLTIVVDLVMLLNSFLGGETSTRFILKVLAVLVVAAAIFAYYILNLRSRKEREKTFQAFSFGSVIFVIAALVFGFMYMGSPTTQRQVRFDIQRINDLQTIQWQIVGYWQQKEKLPTSLEDLNNPISSFVVPHDPKTSAPYEYKSTSATSFELCATFELASRPGDRSNSNVAYPTLDMDSKNNSWLHQVGKQCFTRTIDPELYPPNRSTPSGIMKPAMINL
jgi:hypothetical protein